MLDMLNQSRLLFFQVKSMAEEDILVIDLGGDKMYSANQYAKQYSF